MRKFGRWFFGLTATDEKIRRGRSSYGILAVLWFLLGISRLFRTDPFEGWNLVGIVLALVVVILLVLSVVLRTLELRRRSQPDAASSDLLG